MQHIFRAMGRCRKNCFEKWQKVCSGRIIILQQITMYLSCSPVFLSDSKLNCSFLQLAYTSAACLFKSSKCCFTMGRQFLAATQGGSCNVVFVAFGSFHWSEIPIQYICATIGPNRSNHSCNKTIYMLHTLLERIISFEYARDYAAIQNL